MPIRRKQWVLTSLTRRARRSILLTMHNSMLSALLLLVSTALADALCPTGALQGIHADDCYKYVLDSASWFDAEDKCQQSGGYLTSVPNAFVNSFLLNEYGSMLRASNYWLGGNKGLSGTAWAWSDGSSFSYQHWAKGHFITLFY